MDYISVKHLKLAKACSEQVVLFRETFGESVGFSSKEEAVALAVKYAQVFDFCFMGKEVFKDAYAESEATLWEAYKESEAPFWKAYEEDRARIFAEMWWDLEQE